MSVMEGHAFLIILILGVLHSFIICLKIILLYSSKTLCLHFTLWCLMIVLCRWKDYVQSVLSRTPQSIQC